MVYNVWTGRNRLGHYDKDSSPWKGKDKKKEFFGAKVIEAYL